jgi:hypothetical protein
MSLNSYSIPFIVVEKAVLVTESVVVLHDAAVENTYNVIVSRLGMATFM